MCHGTRYNRDTLEVRYKGKTISEVLDMPIADAAEFFGPVERIARRLRRAGRGRAGLRAARPAGEDPVRRRGAAGEARRGAAAAFDRRTIYLLDEPTSGLHAEDVRKLLGVLHSLVGLGNTVLVIEHNLDVIKTADWVIDLGPEERSTAGRSSPGAPGVGGLCRRESRTGQFLRAKLTGTAMDTGTDADRGTGRSGRWTKAA